MFNVLMTNMLTRHSLLIAVFVLLCGEAAAELKALEDDYLSGVSGQSGLTLDLEANVNVAEFAYFDDGLGIALQGIRLTSEADPTKTADFRFDVDVLNSGTLALGFFSKNTARFEIDNIRFVNSPGATPLASDPSLGGLYFDFWIDGSLNIENRGNSAIGARQTLGGIYDIDFDITNGRLGYRTNDYEFFLDGLSLDVNSMGTVLGYSMLTGELNLEMPNLLAELKVDAIRYSNNPLNHGVTNDVVSTLPLPSYGSLWANLDANFDLQILAGGAYGLTGMTLNSQATINRLDLAWGDDTDWANSGYWIGALGTSGSIGITNLKIDVLNDPDQIATPAKDYGVGLALAFERIAANLHIQDFVIGETKANIDAYVLNPLAPVKSIGSVDINLLFADGAYDATPRTNVVYVQAGGNTDAGYQGLRLDTQLNIISDDINNQSNFVYTDDGNSMMLSRFEAYADGDITVDITAAGTLGSTEFYDGLRVGFEDFAFGYRVEGYRVAKDTGDLNDLKAQDVQAAQEIPGLSGGIAGLGGHPSLEGTLNGHVTLGPGGNDGQEGITINSDLSVSNGTMAQFINGDGSGKGIWLSGLNYDVHLRDMMLDVTNEGLKIYEGESWSRLDVTDFRVGDKATGASFGRLILETYEVGSETTISAGGAGSVCIGGDGNNEAQCNSDNGRWEDRGNQGLTIATKRHFADSIELDGKRNRLTWETDRFGEGGSSPVNGSGMQLVFDNFTTGDGNGMTDGYGFRSDYHIDVSRTRVVKKTTGPDSNGVVGNKGDEKIMNADGSYRYVALADLTPADIANRPVGVAVRTNTSFRELDFERVNLVHGPSSTESTMLYGLRLQNFDLTTDITATPLD